MILTYNPIIDKLLKDVITDLHYRGITTKFSMTDYVKFDGTRSNGYFDADKREFACAIGKPLDKWLKTFIHESCHFDQWKENCQVWRDINKLDTKDEDLLWEWIAKKWDIKDIHDYYRLCKTVDVTRDIELDCEKRTILKIYEYNVPIDISKYSQAAWSYVLFYNYILESRKWYVIGKEPYNNEELKKLMPSTLFEDEPDMIKKPELTNEMRLLYAQCVK